MVRVRVRVRAGSSQPALSTEPLSAHAVSSKHLVGDWLAALGVCGS